MPERCGVVCIVAGGAVGFKLNKCNLSFIITVSIIPIQIGKSNLSTSRSKGIQIQTFRKNHT